MSHETLTRPTITAVFEFNFDGTEDVNASIWLFQGDQREAVNSEQEIDSIAGGLLLAKEMPQVEATELFGRLVAFLRKSGVLVHEENIADD